MIYIMENTPQCQGEKHMAIINHILEEQLVSDITLKSDDRNTLIIRMKGSFRTKPKCECEKIPAKSVETGINGTVGLQVN